MSAWLVATAAFKAERLGNHPNRQRPDLLGTLGHDRSGARPGAATHAGGDKHHIGTFEGFYNFIPAFLRGLLANLRVSACAETFRQFFAYLNPVRSVTEQQGLSVSVQGNELHPLQTGGNHSIYGIVPPPPTPITFIAAN